MATKTLTTLTDDIDGSPADVTLSYSWAGQSYEIDLNHKNADDFAEAVAPYLTASRRASRPAGVGRRRAQTSTLSDGAAAGGGVDPKAVRAWAHEHGMEVSPRGRISRTVLEQYRATQ